MRKQPVNNYMQILEAFRKENTYKGLGVNSLWRATGSKDKPAILKGISFLRRCEIIQTERINKQKVLNELTPLGRQLIELLNDIERYAQSVTRLRVLASDYYKLKGAGESRKSKLLKKGWTNLEIESFDVICNALATLSEFCDKNIHNGLLHRYYFILVFYRPNEDAQNVLLGIILEQIKIHLIGQGIKVQDDSNYLEGNGESLSTLILNDINRIYYDHDVLYRNNTKYRTNRLITEHVQDLLFSFVALTRLNLNLADFFIEELLKLKSQENQYELDEIIGVFKSYLSVYGNKGFPI